MTTGKTIALTIQTFVSKVNQLNINLHALFLKFPWKESCDQPRQHIKKQRHYFVNKGPSNQSYGFFSSHVKVGLSRKLSVEELMLLNCGVGEDS